jgi:hypothetical protein
MKTPLHELLDLESELTRMFDSDERVAMAILDKIRTTRKEMLQKEKDVMCDFVEYCDEANRNYQDTEESWCEDLTIDDMFDKRFNTKQK